MYEIMIIMYYFELMFIYSPLYINIHQKKIISSYIYWHVHIFFAKVSVQTFCLFYIRMFVFVILSFESTWYILDVSLLSDFCSENTFSQFVAFLNSIFQREGVLNFDEVQFVIFFF